MKLNLRGVDDTALEAMLEAGDFDAHIHPALRDRLLQRLQGRYFTRLGADMVIDFAKVADRPVKATGG